MREITESDLHGVADELLAKGEDADALIHLFSLDRDELRWTGADAFESLLRSWGGGTVASTLDRHRLDLAARARRGANVTGVDIAGDLLAARAPRPNEEGLKIDYQLGDAEACRSRPARRRGHSPAA